MTTLHSFKTFRIFVLLCLLCIDLSSAVLIDTSTTNISNPIFDYVIVGCGTSGLVLANRLSEDPDVTVLCLEAGGLWVVLDLLEDQKLTVNRDQNEDFIRFPIYIGLQPPCAYEWCLTSTPQTQLDGQIRRLPMGKGVGGGSLINGMLWNRGGQNDFDNWAALGNPGWNWDDLLPYFKKVKIPSKSLCPILTNVIVGDIYCTMVCWSNSQLVGCDGHVQTTIPRHRRSHTGFLPRVSLAILITLVRSVGRLGYTEVR